MCPYWDRCASRGGAHPVGRLGHAEEAAGQAGPLHGLCGNGEGGQLGRAQKRKLRGGWAGLAPG
jgi:hypothetical protein